MAQPIDPARRERLSPSPLQPNTPGGRRRLKSIGIGCGVLLLICVGIGIVSLLVDSDDAERPTPLPTPVPAIVATGPIDAMAAPSATSKSATVTPTAAAPTATGTIALPTATLAVAPTATAVPTAVPTVAPTSTPTATTAPPSNTASRMDAAGDVSDQDGNPPNTSLPGLDLVSASLTREGQSLEIRFEATNAIPTQLPSTEASLWVVQTWVGEARAYQIMLKLIAAEGWTIGVTEGFSFQPNFLNQRPVISGNTLAISIPMSNLSRLTGGFQWAAFSERSTDTQIVGDNVPDVSGGAYDPNAPPESRASFPE